MPYIICSNDNYLVQTVKGLSIVNDMKKATKWRKITSANGVCNSVNSGKKYDEYNFEVKYVSQENKIINTPARPIELDYSILDKVKEIAEFAKQIERRRLYLIEMIQEVDLNIVDIEHAVEFYDLNASQGYKIYKLLHDERVKRRKLKTELDKINLSLGTPIKYRNIEKLERSIIGLDNRKYAPRINKELFGV